MDILLVDDNEDFLNLVKEVLNESGYAVYTASDGVEGCNVLASSDIDLIISDIRMPRLDGIKLHAFARATDRYKTTKFVFISGAKEAYEDVVKLNPTVDYFLDKRITLDDLVKFVDTLIFGRYEEAWI